MDDDVIGLRLEVVVERTAPCPLGEALPLGSGELVRGGVVPFHVVARLPAMVGHEVDLEALVAGDLHDCPQMVEQVHLFGYCFGTRPQLAAFAQEVVVGVDQQDRGGRGIIAYTNLLSPRRLAAPAPRAGSTCPPRQSSDQPCDGRRNDPLVARYGSRIRH